MFHEGNLVITKANQAEFANISEVGGSCDIYKGASAPMLAKVGYINVSGFVRVSDLTGKVAMRGSTYQFEQVDCITMIISGWRKSGDVMITKARYFGGAPFEKMNQCYIAKSGALTAHGDTLREAKSDLQFKVLSETSDKSEIVSDVIKSGYVTFNQWRLITGACGSGTRHFLLSHDIDPEKVNRLTIKEVLKLTKGEFGGALFADAIAAN